jgi:disulfide bond formation protein DsbB
VLGNRPMSRDETLLFAAFVIALASTLGALFIGEVLGQAPCVLCWYQRIAMFPLPVLLGIAAFRGDTGICIYVAPLAFSGLLVALWHMGLIVGIIPEPIVPCTREGASCTSESMMILGVPIPLLSLMSFAAIAALMIAIKRGVPS